MRAKKKRKKKYSSASLSLLPLVSFPPQSAKFTSLPSLCKSNNLQINIQKQWLDGLFNNEAFECTPPRVYLSCQH